MKGKFFLLICLMINHCFCSCASGASKKSEGKPVCSQWMKPDSEAYDKLGKRLTTLLFAPKSVKCYHLIGKETIAKDDVEIEKNFVRDTLLATLKSDEITVLQYALLKPAKSYRNDSIKVMSPYMPILEFEFSNKKEKAHIVISLSDMTWTLFYDDKRQFNFTYANEELFAQFCNYYVSLYRNKKK